MALVLAGSVATAVPDESPAPPRVRIAWAGPAALDATFGARVSAWFGADTALDVIDEREAPKLQDALEGVRVRVAVDAQQADVEFVVIRRELAAPRRLLRHISLESGLDELGQERLAQMIYATGQALWAGRSVAAASPSPLAETRPSDTAPPASALPAERHAEGRRRLPPGELTAIQQGTGRRRRGAVVGASLGWGAVAQGGEGVGQGPCVRAVVARPGFPSELTFELQYRLPHRFDAGPLEIELETLALRAGAGLSAPIAARLRFATWMGLGVDRLGYRATRSSDAALVPTTGTSDLGFSALLAASLRLMLSRDISLSGELRVEAPFEHASYRVREATSSRELARASSIQPGAFLVVSVLTAPP